MEDSKKMILAYAKRPGAYSTNGHESKYEKSRSEEDSRRSLVKTLSTNLSLNNGRSFGDSSRVPNPPKPQFYFGQNLNSLVKKSPFLEQQRQAQSAMEKVKRNKAHPQVEEPKFMCGRLSPKFRKVAKNDAQTEPKTERKHESFNLTSPTLVSTFGYLKNRPKSRPQSVEREKEFAKTDQDDMPNLPDLLKAHVRNLTRSPNCFSKQPNCFSKPPNCPIAKKCQRSPSPAARKVIAEKTQEEMKREFEAELIAGKSRLRKLTPDQISSHERNIQNEVDNPQEDSMTSLSPINENESLDEVFDSKEDVDPIDDEDISEESPIVPDAPEIILPPPPPPPPPPPLRSPPPVSLKTNEKCEIPPAPKLTYFGPTPAETKRKGMVAPNGLSAREELLQAIRGKGGFHGLRKTTGGQEIRQSTQTNGS